MFDVHDFPRGAPLPPVEAADLSAVLKRVREYASRHEQAGQLGAHAPAVGLEAFKMVASPDADGVALWFRAVLLHIFLKHGKFAEFQHQGELREDFLRLWASFPLKAVDVKPGGEFSLNESEFEEAVRQLPRVPGASDI
jgi:hypothetical protein